MHNAQLYLVRMNPCLAEDGPGIFITNASETQIRKKMYEYIKLWKSRGRTAIQYTWSPYLFVPAQGKAIKVKNRKEKKTK